MRRTDSKLSLKTAHKTEVNLQNVIQWLKPLNNLQLKGGSRSRSDLVTTQTRPTHDVSPETNMTSQVSWWRISIYIHCMNDAFLTSASLPEAPWSGTSIRWRMTMMLSTTFPMHEHVRTTCDLARVQRYSQQTVVFISAATWGLITAWSACTDLML